MFLSHMLTNISNAYYCLSREYWKENPHDRVNNISYLDNMDPAAKDVEFIKDTSVVSAIPTMGEEAKQEQNETILFSTLTNPSENWQVGEANNGANHGANTGANTGANNGANQTESKPLQLSSPIMMCP